MLFFKTDISGKSPRIILEGIKIKSIHGLKNYIDDNGTEHFFKTGETIYHEGKHSVTVYLVIKGVVKTHKLDEMGKELITGIYKPDDFFGFSSFTNGAVHTETASAMEATELVGISSQNLKRLLEESHDLAMDLM